MKAPEKSAIGPFGWIKKMRVWILTEWPLAGSHQSLPKKKRNN